MKEKEKIALALAELDKDIAELETLEREVTIEEITSVFAKAMKTLINVNTKTFTEEEKASVIANYIKLKHI